MGPTWGPGGQIGLHFYSVFQGLRENRVFAAKSSPRGPKRRPGGPKSGSRGAWSGQRSVQERAKRPQESLRSVQERPKSRPNSASERFWRPSGVHQASGSSPEAYLSRFSTSRGTIFHPPGSHVDVFKAPGCIFEAVLWTTTLRPHHCPVCQAYASIRPASLDALVSLLHVESLLHVD